MAILNTKQQLREEAKTDIDLAQKVASTDVKIACQSQIDLMSQGTPEYEVQTFDIQETEWVAWSVDNTSPTPNCDRIALGRGMDRVELLTRVGIKVTAVFDILGAQQGQVDLIEACTTIEELEALLASV